MSVYAERLSPPPLPPALVQKAPQSWFQRIKPYCNPLEVARAIKRNPPPQNDKDQAMAVACYALAGKFNLARQRIQSFPENKRMEAANTVFNVAHHIADSGDDEAAGPIMQFVVEFSPDHFMALYHAGASLYETSLYADAKGHLIRFLEIYKANDGWSNNAKIMLQKIEAKS